MTNNKIKSLKQRKAALLKKIKKSKDCKWMKDYVDDIQRTIDECDFNKREDWPCRNCERRFSQHDGTYFGELACEERHLAGWKQKAIADGNIIPEADWDEISYQPMDTLEYIEWLHKDRA